MRVQEQPQLLPRLLAGLSTPGRVDLDAHLDQHGELPTLVRYRGRSRASSALDEIERAGLLGRGGAAFPTAAKMRAVAGRRRAPVVVANGCEGEPTSRKDRLLLERLPHLVLDGAAVAAAAIGAREVFVCIDHGAVRARTALEHAVRERRQYADRSMSVRIVGVPGGYVCSQESALVQFLNGGPAKPTIVPVYERGVAGRPTLVDNVETLAHIALIARHGAEWFRGLGSPAHPGSTLLTVGGAVLRPGVYELDPAMTVAELVDAAGGVREAVDAVLIGGYAGAWLKAPQSRSLHLSHEPLAAAGASLGPGLLYLLDSDTCGIAEIASVARWMSDQTAQQCGPCVNGLAAIAQQLEAIVAGRADRDAARRIERWCTLVPRRGACAHPDGTTRFVSTGLHTFEHELADHIAHGPCELCLGPRRLPVPRPQPVAVAA